MADEPQPIEKPNLENLEMHMPEGEMAIPETEPPQKITNGPILILLTLIHRAILGCMYWWYVQMSKNTALPEYTRPTPEENNEPESTTAEAQTETMQAVSTSDELGAIEGDLEGTNLDALDAEIEAIESELDGTEN